MIGGLGRLRTLFAEVSECYTLKVDLGYNPALPKGVCSDLKRRNLVIIVLLLGAGVASLMTWSVIEKYLDAGRKAGFELKVEDVGLRVTHVEPGMAAEKAGIKAGDLIRKVQGVEVRSLADYDAQARTFRMGHPVALDLTREGVFLRLELRPGVELDWFPIFLVDLTILAYFLLGLVAFFQGPEDIRARLLFGFSLAVAVEMAIPDFIYGPAGARTFAGMVFFLVSGIEMVLELHLAAVIPDKHSWIRKYPWLLWLLYTCGLGFGALGALSFGMESLGVSWWPTTTVLLYNGLNKVIFPIWALSLVLLLGSQAIHYPVAQGRHQAGLVLVGVFPWTIYALAGTVYPDFYNAIASYNDVALSIILFFFPAAVFLAIFKYRLFDLERVVRRGLVYFTMSFILVGVFLFIFNLGAWILSGTTFEKGRLWLTSGAMLVLGMLFSPVHSMVQRAVERRFFPERSALRRHLIDLAAELPSFGDLPGMGHALVDQLQDIFEVETVILMIKRPGATVLSPLASTITAEGELQNLAVLMIPEDLPGVKFLRSVRRPVLLRQIRKRDRDFARMLSEMDVMLALPLMQKEDLIGVFFIGQRVNGGRYPAEELELLNLLSHHVATSFENARLFESATYESLTGLLRREAVLAQLEKEMERAYRYERPLSIAMADLDRFKNVNDSYGHLSGDSLLRKVSMVMRSCLRATDVLGRYGGEEFLFVLPETTIDEAGVVAEKIRKEVGEIRMKDPERGHFGTTISIGLAGFDVWKGNQMPTVEEAINLADEALYIAKAAGRDCVRRVPDGSLRSGHHKGPGADE